MAASYPSQVAIFPTHVNLTEIIDAAHPNNIQNEVVAIEASLGTNPQISSTPNPSSTFNASSTEFASVSERLNNIEVGIVSDSHNQYLRKTSDSGNVITTGASNLKGLVIKGSSSQTSNLQEWQTSAGTVVCYIDGSGDFHASGTLNGTASGNVALSTITTAGDLIVGSGSGAVTRLGVGSSGQILASNGSAPYWTSTLSVQGAQGTQGTAGYIGADGAQGAQGASGYVGSDGAQGAQGAQGATGAGTQGATGAQGPLSAGPADMYLSSVLYV